MTLIFGKRVKITFACISPFLNFFILRCKNLLYKKCLQPQNYINHLKKAYSELLGAIFQRNVSVKVFTLIGLRNIEK